MSCCKTMTQQLAQTCEDHENCPDVVIEEWPDGTLVIPIRDGGSSGVLVAFCPWCGIWVGTSQARGPEDPPAPRPGSPAREDLINRVIARARDTGTYPR